MDVGAAGGHARPDGRRWPRELLIAAGAAAVVAGCVVAALAVPPPATGRRLLLLAVVLAVYGVLTAARLAAAVTGALAWPFYVGFLVNRHGELSWHAGTDVSRLAVLVGVPVAGALVARAAIGRRLASSSRHRHPVSRSGPH